MALFDAGLELELIRQKLFNDIGSGVLDPENFELLYGSDTQNFLLEDDITLAVPTYNFLSHPLYVDEQGREYSSSGPSTPQLLFIRIPKGETRNINQSGLGYTASLHNEFPVQGDRLTLRPVVDKNLIGRPVTANIRAVVQDISYSVEVEDLHMTRIATGSITVSPPVPSRDQVRSQVLSRIGGSDDHTTPVDSTNSTTDVIEDSKLDELISKRAKLIKTGKLSSGSEHRSNRNVPRSSGQQKNSIRSRRIGPGISSNRGASKTSLQRGLKMRKL